MPVLLFLFAIAGVLALAPMLIGIDVESRYQTLLGQLEQAGFVVVQHDYQRGWLRSSSSALLEFPTTATENDNQVAAEKPGLALHSDITHGLFSPDRGLGMAEIHSELGSGSSVTDRSSLNIRTIIRLDGSGESLVASSRTPLTAKSGQLSTEISELFARITFDGKFTRGSVSLDIPELSLDAVSGNSLGFSGTSASSGWQIGPDGISLDDGSAIRFSRIKLTEQGRSEPAILEQPSLEFSVTEQNGQIDVAIDYLHQSLTSSHNDYGPATLRIRLENLSKKALENIGQSLDQLLAGGQDATGKENLLFATLLITGGVELLKYNPALAIERLHLVTPDGAIEGNASLKLSGMGPARTINASDILNRLSADASLSIPEQSLLNVLEKVTLREITQQFEQRRTEGEEVEQPDELKLRALSVAGARARLDHLVQQQLLVRKGNLVTTHVKLGDGLLAVNGMQVPLLTSEEKPAH